MTKLQRTALFVGFAFATVALAIGVFLTFSVGRDEHMPLPLLAALAIIWGLLGYRVTRRNVSTRA